MLTADEELLHPTHGRPARCFAYVGDANDPGTWKLPFLTTDGNPDTARLSGAIRCIVANYRGGRVKGIPESDIPDVLVSLGKAARRLGKMPGQSNNVTDTYRKLHNALAQFNRLDTLD